MMKTHAQIVIALFLFFTIFLVIFFVIAEPSIVTLTLSATSSPAFTTDNLTAVATANETTDFIYEWFKNGIAFNNLQKSTTRLAMTFNSADGTYNNSFAQDLSSYENHGVDVNAIYNSTTGAYDFDCVGDYINISKNIMDESNWTVHFEFMSQVTGIGRFVFESSLPAHDILTGNGRNIMINRGGFQAIMQGLANDTWYNATYVGYANGTVFGYIDGVLNVTDTNIFNLNLTTGNLGNNWCGSISSFYVFAESFNERQIQSLIEGTSFASPTIPSADTAAGQSWYVTATPTNANGQGAAVQSNTITIRSDSEKLRQNGTALISIESITSITNNVASINFGAGHVNVTNSCTSCGMDSNGKFNQTGDCCNQFTNVTSGFLLENTGNINISVNYTCSGNCTAAQFVGGTNPAFELKVTNNFVAQQSGEQSGSIDSTASCLSFGESGVFGGWNISSTNLEATYVDITAAGAFLCGNLTHFPLSPVNSQDAAVVDLNVSIPADAPPGGQKTATFTFNAFSTG